MKRIRQLTLLVALSWIFSLAHAQLPEGFELTMFSDEINGGVTLEFAENGNIYAGDQMGRIWVFVDGELQTDPVIDISEEVGGYAELGCLGFVLHPDFLLNGYIYMYYAVDRHHLMNYGTPDYNPDANEYYNATIGRVSRFQVQLDDYSTLIPGSQTILFGQGVHDGNPILTFTHGNGDILFGEDGTLLLSCGDGNTFENTFAGGDEEVPPNAYDPQGIADGIIWPEENVGSFRAQMIHSYSGKVFRIDAETGEGLPSNPFYDPEAPDAAQSKVWAMGLRNPYRMTLRQGTGSSNPEDGQPGTLYISDVGSSYWEELNVCDGPGYNFGWPIFEGMGTHPEYSVKIRKNFFQPNPLQPEGCTTDYFNFQQLIQQENGIHSYSYPNPCNEDSDIANYAVVFHHTRPTLTYRNTSWNPAGAAPLQPGFDEENNAIGIEITSPELGVEQAEDFGGIASMVGDFYTADEFPEDYHNIIATLDYTGWLKAFWFDENHNLTKMEHWLDSLENVIDVRINPYDGCYYLVGLFPSEIQKLCFVGNLQPVVTVEVDPPYGPGPLEVSFDASGTYDPEGDPLTFEWNFGDGEFDTGPTVIHTYTAPEPEPYSYTATLTVSDTAGNVVVEEMLVSLFNSPPAVSITSIENNQLFSMEGASAFPMEANVVDAEHGTEELNYDWRTYLHHNTHFHPLGESTNQSDIFVANPVGCEEFNEYYYRVSLSVTDPEGLEGYDEVYLYPDCEGLLSSVNSNLGNGLMLYPNPATDMLFVELPKTTTPSQIEPFEVTIFDVLGQQTDTQNRVRDPNESDLVIDVSSLSPGQYVLRLAGSNRSFVERFIISSP